MKTMLIAALVAVAIVAQAADEITISANVTLSSGNVSQNQKSGDLKYTMTNATPFFASGLLSVSTTITALPVGSVNAPGYLWAKNTATNFYDTATNLVYVYIDMGPTNEAAILPTVRLMAGEVYQGPLAPGASIYFQSGTNTQGLQYFLITR